MVTRMVVLRIRRLKFTSTGVQAVADSNETEYFRRLRRGSWRLENLRSLNLQFALHPLHPLPWPTLLERGTQRRDPLLLLSQQGLEALRGNGPREVKTLKLVTTAVPQKFELLSGFHAFRDELEAVEIDGSNRNDTALAPGVGDGLLQPVLQQTAVGKSRERCGTPSSPHARALP